MTRTDAHDPPTAPHRNRQLFSDHYLDERLPRHAAWRAGAPHAAELMGRVAPILARFTPSPNEAQTENDLVRPVLDALGWAYDVQVPLRAPGRAVRPDYVFYVDAAAVASNKGRTIAEGDVPGGLAIGDAKHWDRPLDQAIGRAGDPFGNQNPGYQIAFYLRHSGLPWGILTNGRLWRLYHRDSAHRLDRFYEVDLPALVAAGEAGGFQFFSHFFGPSSHPDGPLSLDAMLRDSADYAHGVSDGLKRQVYDALWRVAEGFVDHPTNRLVAPDGATLAAVHAGALVLLYRLLFCLYAEAKGLLPLASHPNYRAQYSLDAVKKTVAAQPAGSWAPEMVTLWPRLGALFRAIDAGAPSLGVPAFNGGLFSARNHPDLESWVLGDAALAGAVDLLARVDGEFIDYRDLASQHLGTIYEGLLEFHLRLNPESALNGWTTELVTSKGERKASGSYYTPGYVTRLMTERTLGPVVDAALAGATHGGAADRARAVLALDVVDPAMGSGHFLVEAVDYLAERLVAEDLLPEELRDSEGILAPGIERSATGHGIDELAYWKRRVAQSCVYGVDINPLAVELAKLSIWLATAAGGRPLSFLDHHLRVGNSLVGMRLADLDAGATPRAPKPRGRAAAQRAEAASAAGQLSWFADDAFRRSLSTAVDGMWLIEAHPSDSLDDVREQERLYAALRADLNRRFAPLADLATATRLGLDVSGDLADVARDVAAGRSLAAPAGARAILDDAAALAAEGRFFHWELEFPEVFFDRHGRSLGADAGFAAVLGNPPYIRQEALGALKDYLRAAYPETYSGVADIYVYFYQRGYELLRAGGRMAYIVTNKWLRAGYGEALRGYFAATGAVEEIVDFGHAPIFEDADVFPCILWLRRPAAGDENTPDGATTDGATSYVTEYPRDALKSAPPSAAAIAAYISAHRHTVPRARFSTAPWNLEPQPVVDLMDKIRRNGVPLAEFAGVKPYRGVLTGLNEAFLVDTPTRDRLVAEDPRSAEIIRPYLRGQDIKRWAPEWAGLWMIVLASSENREWAWSGNGESEAEAVFALSLPAIHRHMKPLEARLRKRQDRGVYWWELRSCTYYGLFEAPKIVYQEIQFHASYCRDDMSMLTNNKAFLLAHGDNFLLAVLNSHVMWWHNWRYLPHMKDEALSPVGELMIALPIAPPTPAIRDAVEPAVERLVAVALEGHAARRALLDWLKVEFAVEKPGRALEDFAKLADDAFVAEVRARRPKAAGPLSPAALQALRAGFAEIAGPARARAVEADRLEHDVAALVNAAYGLTPEDVDLLWRTAPPRMPVGRA